MYIIEVTESKMEHLADTVGKMLHYGGKAMECIEDMRRGSRHDRMGFRDDQGGYDNMGERGGNMGYREDGMRPEDYDRMGERMYDGYGNPYQPWPPFMGERRRRSPYTGRYVHG